jgi:hypothetical protein
MFNYEIKAQEKVAFSKNAEWWDVNKR